MVHEVSFLHLYFRGGGFKVAQQHNLETTALIFLLWNSFYFAISHKYIENMSDWELCLHSGVLFS